MAYSNQLQRYAQADIDQDGPNYFGYLTSTGAWYIVRETTTGMQINYAYSVGGSNYTTNWTNRTSLSYSTYDQVFKG